jgi:hypothetical protein
MMPVGLKFKDSLSSSSTIFTLPFSFLKMNIESGKNSLLYLVI